MSGESTTLSLDYLFETTAGQTYTYHILGEVSKTMVADEIIKVDVPIADMNRLLTYSSSWTSAPGTASSSGWQPLPAVALRLPTVLGSILDAVTHGLTGGQTGDYAADEDKQALTDASGVSRVTLPSYFRQIGEFVYRDDAGATADHLSLIPREAIERFETSDVDTLPLSQVIPDIAVVPEVGATGPYGEDEELKAAVQALFEQAVDAGMVQPAGHTLGQATDLSSETITHGDYSTLGDVRLGQADPLPVYGAQFSPTQTLGIYVKFDLTKNREYQLSDNLNPNSGSVSSAISFGGVTFDSSALDNDVSDPVSRIYQIVLKAVAE
jgi:hypothetical protein